jgi:hypothetical protein
MYPVVVSLERYTRYLASGFGKCIGSDSTGAPSMRRSLLVGIESGISKFKSPRFPEKPYGRGSAGESTVRAGESTVRYGEKSWASDQWATAENPAMQAIARVSVRAATRRSDLTVGASSGIEVSEVLELWIVCMNLKLSGRGGLPFECSWGTSAKRHSTFNGIFRECKAWGFAKSRRIFDVSGA